MEPLEVVNALLEVLGRELLMLTTHNGASCLSIACHYHRILRKLQRYGICRLAREYTAPRAAVPGAERQFELSKTKT
jgi:hypothetical protein